MRRQTDAPFGQQQPGLFAHLAVQPRIGRRRFGPCAFVQSAEDDQIGPLHARLHRAPDHDVGVRGIGLTHLFLGQKRAQQVGVICGIHRAAMGGVFGEVCHHSFRRGARAVLPEQVIGVGGLSGGDPFGQCQMRGDAIGQGPLSGGVMAGEGLAQPSDPIAEAAGVFHPLCRAFRDFGQPFGIGIGQPVTADLSLQALGIKLVKVPPRATVCQRMFQQGQQRFGIQFPDE